MEKKEHTRIYNMSDAALAQKADETIMFATADSADLVPRGVTPARLAALAVLVEQFKTFNDDAVMLAFLGMSIDNRQLAYLKITDYMGNLRTMAQNAFGKDSNQYETLTLEGFISLNDLQLVNAAKRAIEVAQGFTAALTPEGFSPDFITNYKTMLQDFDTKRDQVVNAEFDRKSTTNARIDLGNIIYTELEKICNTGKDVYRMTNIAKHDTYVLYDTPSGGPTPTPTIVNFTIPMGGYTVLLNQPYNGDLQFEVKNNSSASCKLFLSVDGLTPFGITIPVPGNSTLVKKYSDLAASGNYLILANEDMMLSVSGVFTYPV